MGHSDLYPFVLTPKAIEKLAFVHALTHPQKPARNLRPAPVKAGIKTAAPAA
jgi:hypothetical protein